MAGRWRLEKRRTEATAEDRERRGKGLQGYTELVLIDRDGTERRLGRVEEWRTAGGHWIEDFGFVPGDELAWVVEGASYLSDRDYWLHVHALDPPKASLQLLLHDDHRPGDVRFAPDGSAAYCRRNGYGFGPQPDWIERTSLPEGIKEEVEGWPEGLVSAASCSEVSE